MIVKDINIKDVKIVENVRISIKNTEGLMSDIKQNGLQNAIVVCKTKIPDEYILVSGNRRLEACKKLGMKTIPANIRAEYEVQQLLIDNIAENIHREDIQPLEMGRICDRLKKMGLNDTEMSIKLSVPTGRIKEALKIYHGLPDKYRKDVSYVGRGGQKDGTIPAGVAAKICRLKKSYGLDLSDQAMEKLFTVAKVDEMKTDEVHLVSVFLKEGFSVDEAIKKGKDFTSVRAEIFIKKSELESLLDKYELDFTGPLLTGIIYGEIPPLKKPDFVKLRQTAKNVK